MLIPILPGEFFTTGGLSLDEYIERTANAAGSYQFQEIVGRNGAFEDVGVLSHHSHEKKETRNYCDRACQ